ARARADAAIPETPEPDESDGEPSEPLPPVESLTADSDYTPFLRHGVPDELRRLALRKLWRTDPVLANLDGLNDYDEDFTGGTLGAVVATAYKVGKGMIRRVTDGGDESEHADRPDQDPETVAEVEDTDAAVSDRGEPG
ncbi:MAG: DUF3306 domain-containing protein, partial [Alphaproteobacteria bacterium]|nr:DUF3306 domain-containing protein [Alphaproteobacteria bacterium]